ncbi:MAG: FIST N-terminal domain-containing protein [Acidimicrobiia bacterium]
MLVHTLSYSAADGWSAPFPTVDPARTLIFCFGASEYLADCDPIVELASLGGFLIGCSTAGEIHGPEVADGTLAVAIAEFEHTRLRVTAEQISSGTSYLAGGLIGEGLRGDGLRAVFVLSDGLDVNGSDLVAGLTASLPEGVVVTGGLAGDGSRFERTWVIVDGKPASGFVTAVGLYGDRIEVGHGSKGGWDIFGPERTVTRSTGNVVYELDGRPVLALYKEYLGDLAAELPASGLLFPLAVRAPGDDKQLVRTILGIDEEAQSLIFAGDVPQGHRVQLMQAQFDRLIGGAEAAAAVAVGRIPGEPSLSVAISCVGRRLVLGERTEDELEATLHALPDGIAQVGFYSYGEISPYGEGTCDLHNQTMTLTTLGEVA